MLQQRDERSLTYFQIRAKYRDLQQQFTMLRQYFYRIECAWCKSRIGWKCKDVHVPGETTYGICPQCVADMVSKGRREPPDRRPPRAGYA
jgi:hypothetical protein